MGDGGVACIPFQHSSIMERFPIQDKAATTTLTTLCSGGKTTGSSIENSTTITTTHNTTTTTTLTNDNNNSSSNNGKSSSNGVNSKPKRVVKKIIKVRKVVPGKKVVAQKTGLKSAQEAKSNKQAENGSSSVDNKSYNGKEDNQAPDNKEDCKVTDVKEDNKAPNNNDNAGATDSKEDTRRTNSKEETKSLNSKEEVEEGELGTLKWPPKVEAQNEEVVPSEKLRRSDIEKGEIVGEKWKKGDIDKGELFTGKWRRGEVSRDETEKGEFIPDRWHGKDDYSYGKSRARYDAFSEYTPPSGKYFSEEAYRRKELSRNGNSQHSRNPSRWESGQDRNVRISSKIADEEGSYKSEYSNGKSHSRDYTPVNRLKRHGLDSDSIERKHYTDYGDYTGSKSRRLSDDSTRAPYSEHHSRHSVDRFYRNSSSSRISSLDKYSRHHEPTLSSKVVYDRHARSPGHSERSPRERPRYHDYRERSPVRRERSPFVRDRSPYIRESPYGRERSPYGRERSPYDRSRHYDYRNKSPTYSERSPHERVKYHDRRDRTPNHLDRSPRDRSRLSNHGEGSRKGGVHDKRISQYANKGQDDKLSHKENNGKDLPVPVKESQDKSTTHNVNSTDEKNESHESLKEEQSNSPIINDKESPFVSGPPPEELLSMEEDMDICDTPPHVPVVSDSIQICDTIAGKWFYLDYFGLERGPSKLCDLKALVSEGVLESDHLIKHLDSDRWVTVENAVSPLVTANFQSIVADSITRLVNPPEAPGNLLEDAGDIGQPGVFSSEEVPVTLPGQMISADDGVTTSEPLEDLHIDERVGVLLDGFTFIPGRELETIGEILHMSFNNVPYEGLGKLEVSTHVKGDDAEQHDQNCNDQPRYSDLKMKEDEGSLTAFAEKDHDFASFVDSADWFTGRWSCKGGDWMRNDEGIQDRFSRRKLVLNDGFLLCQMPKSGFEDPRWQRSEDLYYPAQSRRLELPTWAFSCSEENNDCGGVSRSTLTKPPVARGVKGIVKPVVRINACVVKDHGSFVSESRMKVRGKDRYSSRSSRAFSATNDVKRSTTESDSQSKGFNDQESYDYWKSGMSFSTPKDRLCSVDDLKLQLGEWYYLDGAGHEQGPASFSDLQALADQGAIQKYSSVFRKIDRLWVPVNSITEMSEANTKTERNVVSSGGSNLKHSALNETCTNLTSFHSLHPQFIGYTRGKLHELVMKSYKSREFAAAINEVLDPWIIAKQPKKENDKHIYRRSENDGRAGKRARMQVDGSDEDYETEEDLQTIQNHDIPFEELCGNTTFCEEQRLNTENEIGSWGLLDGHMLARVFHFMRFDMKSLVFASLTCKHWRDAVSFYKDISRQVDLSSVGPNCTDSMVRNVMNGYNKEKITSMVLAGCTNITPSILEEILRSYPCLSSIDIRGCSQLTELALQFPSVSWIKPRTLRSTRASDDSYSKVKSLKQIGEKNPTLYKTKAQGGDTDDFGELKEYFDSVNRRDSANQLFRQSLYRRTKLVDARKSSSILSRDARLRRWTMKKSANGYKRMEGFLASGLKDIMKENTFDFFVPKVAEIEDRIKNGYYFGHGMKSVKDDISRMCRDAIKAKSRGAGDMNHIIALFVRLASRLEESSKFSYERDELMKSWKDDLSAGFGSASAKYKKKLVAEKKFRSNGTTFANGLDYGEYASDREIRKRLSKLNRKSMDSGSETSDEFDRSEYGRSDGESGTSDTESDYDFQSEGRNQESRDGYFTADDSVDGMTDEREWGARMTKASLVPPVTRKYEVVDQYVVVADEEDVKRKMCVSLPDDYAEKLESQKNGTEELDLPEVKDYKPRKQLGDEVIEQEVYGIDPYTHNLLLDSMPEEVDWDLLEKHVFIEDVLLRTLNKQVRCFTGTGNTPMTYPLQPVIEAIEKDAEEDCDIRMMKLCRGILKAMGSRPDDNYVAYRKGLGVVCNKEGGFGEEDFVVEFLGEVYPAWKWFEKQDGIRSLQKDSKDPAPEFYNIYLERPKGDADGYDLVVVDAMHKANYASRICHSCRPNCEAKVTAVDGQYQIGIYTVRQIQNGEEVTFDYNSVTESKEEYEASVCLCGSQVCRGSYLNLTGEGAFQKVFKELHGILDRHYLMLEACELNSVSEEDYLDLGRAGLGSCLLGGLPDWVVAYSARLVRFINLERTKLPEEILKHNLEEKRKYLSDICLEVERNDAEVQAEGVYNQRLQNLAVTLDKVRHVMRCVFGDPKKAPPPLEKLSPEETVSFLWKGEGSLVEELLQCMAPHMELETLNDLKSKICAHDPSNSVDIQKELQKSLLWLRDEVRCLPCTYKCRHDAAADLIHVYAYTKCFFRIQEYSSFTSPPVYISPLDLGPKYTDKLGAGIHEYKKTYGENYCMGQLICWHVQTNVNPDCNLAKASRGCISLPDISSFYAKVQKPSQQLIYGPKIVKMMTERMEKYPQKPWPKDQIWTFKNSPKVVGSPMFDAVLNNSTVDREMLHWLKHRPIFYQAMWDR